jgi:hypothetical protein
MPTQIGLLDDGFLRAIVDEDELGAVVRAHIFIEAQVNALIDGLVVEPDKLPRLHFEQRVRLMIALGVSEELSKPLLELAQIRNAFSHRLDTHLNEGIVDKWLACFSQSHRSLIDQVIQRTSADMGLPPLKIKFGVIAVTLRQALKQAQAELDARRSK